MESAGSDTHNVHGIPTQGAKPATSAPSTGSIVIPPYWQAHQRNDSSVSSLSVNRPAPITLEDHTDAGSEQCKALWAKHVFIDDYVVVSGTAPGVGAYVVWNCTVVTLDVSDPHLPSAPSIVSGIAICMQLVSC
jgi:hypothetical protein